MLRIVNGCQNRLRLPLSAVLIPCLFGPVWHGSPISSEGRILLKLLFKGRTGARAVQQLRYVLYVIPRRLSRREIVLICPSGDAGLQRALDGITRNIVCAGISSGFEPCAGIGQSFDRQGLEF